MLLERIYSIIKIGRVEKISKKGALIFILIKKTKYYTKEALKYFTITTIAFGFIIAIILIKYKPVYEVKISGEEVGYIQNKDALEETVKESILTASNKNIDSISINKKLNKYFTDITLEDQRNIQEDETNVIDFIIKSIIKNT